MKIGDLVVVKSGIITQGRDFSGMRGHVVSMKGYVVVKFPTLPGNYNFLKFEIEKECNCDEKTSKCSSGGCSSGYTGC